MSRLSCRFNNGTVRCTHLDQNIIPQHHEEKDDNIIISSPIIPKNPDHDKNIYIPNGNTCSNLWPNTPAEYIFFSLMAIIILVFVVLTIYAVLASEVPRAESDRESGQNVDEMINDIIPEPENEQNNPVIPDESSSEPEPESYDAFDASIYISAIDSQQSGHESSEQEEEEELKQSEITDPVQEDTYDRNAHEEEMEKEVREEMINENKKDLDDYNEMIREYGEFKDLVKKANEAISSAEEEDYNYFSFDEEYVPSSP